MGFLSDLAGMGAKIVSPGPTPVSGVAEFKAAADRENESAARAAEKRGPVSFTGLPQKEYESRWLDWLLPDEPDNSPSISAGIKTVGDIGAGVPGAAQLLYKGVVEHPYQAIAAIPEVGPVTSVGLQAGGAFLDEYIPQADRAVRNVWNGREPGEGNPPLSESLPRAASNALYGGVLAHFFPNTGGINAPGMRTAEQEAAERMVPAASGVVDYVLRREPEVVDMAKRLKFDPDAAWWSKLGLNVWEVPESGLVNRPQGEIDDMGVQALRSLGIRETTPGQRGSPGGELGESWLLSSSFTRPEAEARLGRQLINLDRVAEVSGGQNAAHPEVVAEPIGAQVAKERMDMTAAAGNYEAARTAALDAAEAERERAALAARGSADARLGEAQAAADMRLAEAQAGADAALRKAEDRIAHARDKFEFDFKLASDPVLPPAEAGARLKAAVRDFALAVKEEQNNIRNEALARFPADDPAGVREAAAETAKTLFKLLEDNNMVNWVTEADGTRVPVFVESSHTVTNINPRMADYLLNRYRNLNIRELSPRMLEALRKEIGSKVGEAQATLALEPTELNARAVQTLGKLYDALKEVQLSMFSPRGQEMIRDADRRFMENIDVVQGLAPFLERTDDQFVFANLFGKGKRDMQLAAAKVDPEAFKRVVQARQAQLVADTRGNPELIDAKLRALGQETAAYFDVLPIREMLERRLADIDAAKLERDAVAETGRRAVAEARKEGQREVAAARRAGQQEVAAAAEHGRELVGGVKAANAAEAKLERDFAQAYETRVGGIPGLEPVQNLQSVVTVFSSKNVNKVDSLMDIASRAGKPEAFDAMRAAWLWDAFKTSRSYREFELKLSKTGPAVLEKYFEAPGYVELTNRFRLLAAGRDRLKVGLEHQSRGSQAEMNSIYALVLLPVVGKLLTHDKPAAFFDAFYKMPWGDVVRMGKTTARRGMRYAAPLLSGPQDYQSAEGLIDDLLTQ